MVLEVKATGLGEWRGCAFLNQSWRREQLQMKTIIYAIYPEFYFFFFFSPPFFFTDAWF
jgi:hypothetical protein